MRPRADNQLKDRTPLAQDTSLEICERQVSQWRSMSPDQKAGLISALCRSTRALAEAGIRSRYPSASERERFLRLAVLILGAELARRAYPEVADIAGVT